VLGTLQGGSNTLNKIMRNNPKFAAAYPAASVQRTTGVNLSPSVAPSLSPTPTMIPTFLPAPPGTWQFVVIVLGSVLGAGAVVLVLALFFRHHSRPSASTGDNIDDDGNVGADNDAIVVGDGARHTASAFQAVALNNMTHAQARQMRQDAFDKRVQDHHTKLRQATL